jgi:hypothetical protein
VEHVLNTRLHIHLDAVGGVAGDMFAAAVMDAFPELQERTLADIATVLPVKSGKANLSEGTSAGIRAKRFNVDLAKTDHTHQPDHGHKHHHHDSEPVTFAGISAHIHDSRLSAEVSERAIAILRLLAEAESAIHQIPIEKVHFHEIAGWDSIADVVAAASLAASLGNATWSVSDLPCGSGLVHTQHGMLPVPAPATAMLLEGFFLRDDGISGERVTPTGAAIVRYLASGQNRVPAGKLVATGTGAGTRDIAGMPNILRALVLEAGEERAATSIAVLSFEVDDMTGEEIGVAAERLRAVQGVVDVSFAPRFGKKGRPMHGFRLLVAPAQIDVATEAVFRETSTIGLRKRLEQRIILDRKMETYKSGDEIVRVKRVRQPGGEMAVKTESDDLSHLEGLQARRALKRRAEEGPSS